MRNLSVFLLLMVSACAPTIISIPENAPVVTAEPPRPLRAKVALSFQRLGDGVVAKQYVTSAGWDGKGSRREVAAFHIAPASRAVLTKAFKRIFSNVAVISGKIDRGAYDIVVIPEIQIFEIRGRQALFGNESVNLTYRLYFHDSHGKQYLIYLLDGIGTSATAEGKDLSTTERAIVAAMEDAADRLIKDLPENKHMIAWRVPK